VKELREEFASRFADVRACEEEFRVFSAPFDVDTEKVADSLQMEVIELQCDDALRSKFKLVTPLEFWHSVAASGAFPALAKEDLRIASLFASTY
jgi:hypothetical protein